jgi:hypothetical protein
LMKKQRRSILELINTNNSYLITLNLSDFHKLDLFLLKMSVGLCPAASF